MVDLGYLPHFGPATVAVSLSLAIFQSRNRRNMMSVPASSPGFCGTDFRLANLRPKIREMSLPYSFR